tara:strand:- start:617 stop:1108 length:492 start_codon:yes stop_codon:yes gene_type:complete
MIRVFLIAFITFFAIHNSYSEDFPIPRWVSVKYDAYLRYGPTKDANIIYHYLKSGYPLEVIHQTEDQLWRKIRDPRDGIIGWMHRTVLKSERFAITYKLPFIYGYDGTNKNKILAKIERDVHSKIMKCNSSWCKIKIDQDNKDLIVWVEKKNILGVYPHEIIK